MRIFHTNSSPSVPVFHNEMLLIDYSPLSVAGAPPPICSVYTTTSATPTHYDATHTLNNAR